MTSMDSRLHAAWLSQLAREYRDICYQYGIDLRLPVFAIGGGERQLGSWSAADRRLALSVVLISRHPWNLTLQVLKHEMAHQMCSELHHREDAGHGKLFRECCQRLGLAAPFNRASGDLAATIAALTPGSASTEKGRQIIAKVRKLLALSASDNEHEAALAVQRAEQLLTRHRLDFDGLAKDQELVHRTINTGGQTLAIYRKVICAILEGCFGVRVICASLYDPRADCSFKTVELLGREEEVAVAEHCYHFLENRLHTLWECRRQDFAGHGRIARKSYFLGLLAGFRETLEQSRRPGAEPEPTCRQGHGLPALRCQEQLEAFVAFRFPRLRRMRKQGSTMDRAAYQEAVAAGRKIFLRRPMADGEGETQKTLLLPAQSHLRDR
ncbi:MAG: SprT-like domain-containing protein [Desulfobulbus sp.]|nr:SprT-like domain-containing protein [Desulfobulbus sp.]